MINSVKAVIFTLLLAPLPASGASFTLEEAVGAGLKSDNIIKEETARVSAAEAGLSTARLSRWGGLKLKGMYTRGDDPVYAFATAMKQGSFSMASMATVNDPEPAGNYMAGVEAGVPLYTGGALSAASRMGELGLEASRSGLARAGSGITFKVTYQWLTVLLRGELARAAAAAVASAETELKTARMLMEKGMLPGADYYGAEAIYSTLKGYAIAWKSDFRLEKEKLAITLGLDPSAAPEAAGRLVDADYAAPLSGTDAREARLDIKALSKMAELGAEEERLQAAAVRPGVEAFGAWEANSPALSDFRSNHLAGIRITVPLGDPAYFAKKDAAAARSLMARSRADEARRRADAEIAEARSGYEAAKAALPVARETLAKARQSLELFRPLYRQGRQSVLEVLRAEVSVMQAEAAYYEALYKLHLYHAQSLLATETLDKAAIAAISLKLASPAAGE